MSGLVATSSSQSMPARGSTARKVTAVIGWLRHVPQTSPIATRKHASSPTRGTRISGSAPGCGTAPA
ncbi:MAG: hypothetical protein IT379_07395 [Deltaproteobacteria bacterium]|nr:hypothetical protein [Deltaproteobacteria bacterium]